MTLLRHTHFTLIRQSLLAALFAGGSFLSAQTTWYWEGTDGTWDTTTEIWSPFVSGSGPSFAFTSGSHAVFSIDSASAPRFLSVSGTINVGSITIGSTDATFTSGELTALDQITVNSGKTGLFNTILTGIQAITKSGEGHLILAGANTYSGGTTIAAGTLTIGNGGTIGSVASDIANNAALVFNRSDDVTFGQVISGTGSVTHDGYILRFSQAQTYTGATNIKSGAYLVLATDVDQGLAATTAVDIAAGGYLDFSNHATTIAGLTGSGSVYSFGGSNGLLTVNTAGGQNQTFSGAIGSDHPHFSIAKAGTGSLTLTGANTFTGSTTISGGTLAIAADSALGAAPGSASPGHLTLDGGTLATTASFSLDANRGISLGASGGTLDTADATTLTYDGIIAGSGGLTKAGSGSLTLNGANTFTGDTTLTTGTLTLGQSTTLQNSTVNLNGGTLALGNLTSLQLGGLAGSQNLALTNDSAAALDLTAGSNNASTTFSGNLSGLGSLTKAGSGNLTLSGTNTYAGGTTVSDGTLTGNTASLQGAIASNGAVVFNQATDGTYAGVISGSGTLTKTAAGKLTLTQASDRTGDTVVSAGGIALGNTLTVQNSTVDLAGGALYFGNLTEATLGGLAGSSTLAFTNDDTADVAVTVGGNNASTAFSGTLLAGGSLTKTGTGTLTLSGNNTFNGAATVANGNLALGHSSALQSAAVDVSGGSLAFDGITAATLGSLTGSQNLALTNTDGTPAAVALTVGGNNSSTTYSGVLSGTGSLTKSGSGTLTLSGDNSFAGNTTVSGGTLALGHANALQNSATTLSGGSLTFDDITTATLASLSGSQNLALTNESDAAVTLDVGGNNSSTTYSGVLSGSGSLTKSGSGTLTLSAANTHTGATTAAAGTLVLSQSDTLQNSSLTLNGGTVDFGSLTAITLGGLAGTGNLALTNGSDAALGLTVGNNNTSSAYSGNLSGTGSLTKVGTGNFTLSGTNTYGGATTVSAGTLTATTSSLPGDVANQGALVFDQSSAGTYEGVISGTGSLAKSGSGTVTLTGTNTHSGATTINGGTLSIATDSALGTVPGSYAGGHLTLNGGTLATTASFELAANRGLTFGASSGTLDVADGTTLSYANPLVGNFTKAGLGTLELTNFNPINQNNVEIAAGNLHWNVPTGGYYALSNGVISGAGNLILTSNNSSAMELRGVNTYTGTTTLSGGNIVINADSGFGAAPLSASPGHLIFDGGILRYGTAFTLNSNRGILLTENNGTIDTSGQTVSYGGIIAGTGSLTKANTGYLTLTGANTYSGGTIVSGGTLVGTTSSVRGNITNNSSVVFDQDTDGTFADSMSGVGALTKSGTGNLTLGNALTFSGITVINGGTLTLGHADALQNSTLTNATGLSFGSLTGANLGGLSSSQDLALTNGNAAAVDLDVGGNNANTTYSGVLSGAGALTKSGTGTLTLSGANTFTGDTTISAGTVTLGHTDALQNSTLTTATGLSFGALTSANLGALSSSQDLALTNGSAAAVALNVGNNNLDTNYSGVMSGAGSLTKTGTGNFTLAGNNTYSGGTTVSAGTLTGTTGSLQGNIANNAAVVFNQDTDGSYAGTLSGTGSLTKSGTGQLTLSAANPFSGDTTLSAGGITLGHTNALQNSTVALDGGTLSFGSLTAANLGGLEGDQHLALTNGSAAAVALNAGGNNADTTFSGNLSGNGSLTKSGTGNLTLSGTSTYSGGTTISAGTLTGSTGSLQGNITNNSALVFDQGADGTYANAISGSGSLTKSGSGNLILTGSNAHSGGTTVSAGTLTFNPGGSIAGDISNNGTVVFNRSDDYAYLGVVSGSGGVTNDGYILRFDQAQTYTGPTSVKSGGYLVLSTHVDQGLSASTTVDLESGSFFDFSNRALTIAGLSGAGTVYSFSSNSGHLTLNLADGQTSTFSGTLGSAYPNFALTKSGSGTQVLAGTNTYTGTTTISGGTLQVGDGGTTGTLGSASVVNNANLAVNRSNAYTLANDISGTGSVTQLGTGSLTLSGTNTYTGNTIVSAGTLHLNGSAALYGGTIDATNAAKISLADGTTLGLGVGGGSSFSSSDISTIATHSSINAGAKLALDTANATGGIATLSDLNTGSLNLQKTGIGTLNISGTSTGTGTMGVETGTLVYANTGSFLGGTVNATNAAKISVADGATLAVGIGGTSAFTNSDIDTVRQNTTFGSGSRFGLDTTAATGGAATLNDLNFGATGFTKTGTGSLTLTGTTTLTGSTTVAGGSLIVGSDALLGAAPGAATTGHLNLDGGTLNTTATFALDANRGVAIGPSGGTLEVDDATTLTIASAPTGTGNLTKTGSGSLSLIQGTTSTGTLTVSAGTLNLGDGGTASLASSSVTNSASIVFNHSGDLTYSGTISGSGDLTKTGSGDLTISSLTSTGSLSVLNGNLITSSDINDQTATISGATSSITDSGSFNDIGQVGTGSLSITNGGSYLLTSTSSLNYLTIGTLEGADGTATINGPGSNITSGGRLRVAASGTGTLNIEAGAAATFNRTSDSFVGNSAPGTGTINLTGTDSSLTLGGRLVVGNAGAGTVNIGSGSTVTADRLQLAQDEGSTGTLNLNSGGTLIVSDANGTALETGAGAGTFNFAGGTLKSNGTHDLTITSNATLADSTTSIIDTNGQTGTYAGILSGLGNLTKAGAGTLTLAGTNTYTGATTISGGTLALGASASLASSSGLDLGAGGILDLTAKSGGFTIGSNQTLAGTGTIQLAASQTLTLAGTLAPGNSPGTLTVTGNLILNSGAIIAMELAGSGGVAGTDFDQIVVTGAMTAGGTLNVTAIDDFTPSDGQSFQLFNASSIGGTFAAINLPTLSGATWNTSALYSTGTLSVVTSAVPEPGSFALLVGLGALGWVATRRRRF